MTLTKISAAGAAVGLAILTFCAAGCHKDKKNGQEEIQQVSVALPLVDSVVLHKSYPGYIKAQNSADVMALVNGRILSRNYKEGDYVSKGQVLFIIESTDYRDAVRQAEASLATARSQYDYNSRQYQAMKKALEADAVSEMEVIQSKSAMETSASAIKSAEAALQTARTNLSHCTVTAPVSGHITSPDVTPGNYVAGAAQPVKLASIYDDAVMKAVFNIDETQYRLISDGRAVEGSALYRSVPLIFSPSLPVSFTADLYYTSPEVDAASGTLKLEGKVANKDKLLKDGMFVTVNLPYGTSPHAILIRDASIAKDQLGSYVYVVNDSNKVVYTPIKVGELYQDTLRIVTKGLTPKSRYVTEALLKVRNGETVKPLMQK